MSFINNNIAEQGLKVITKIILDNIEEFPLFAGYYKYWKQIRPNDVDEMTSDRIVFNSGIKLLLETYLQNYTNTYQRPVMKKIIEEAILFTLEHYTSLTLGQLQKEINTRL